MIDECLDARSKAKKGGCGEPTAKYRPPGLRAGSWYRWLRAGLATVLWTSAPAWGGSVDTSFVYQGQLKQVGVPVSNICDFEFSLWDSRTDPSPDSQVGPTLTFTGPEAVPVVDGLFNQRLDFGQGIFDGNDRYLQIAVRCPPATDFTVLTPRQTITATPYALFARETSWYGLLHVPPDIANGDDDTQLSEAQVENYLTNGPVDLALGTTVNGQSISTGPHTVDTNAATRCNGAEVFLDGNGDCVSVDATGSSLWHVNGSSIFYLPGGVGIGTDSPAARLDITDASSVLTSMSLANTSSGQRMLFQVNGSNLASEGRSGNFEIWGVVPEGSRNVFTATPGGNVGIGDTTPGEKLTVAGLVKSTSGGFVFPDGSVQTQAATSEEPLWNSNGAHIYYNSGHVGIGTDSPAARLSVNSANPDITGLTLSNTTTDRTLLFQVNGGNHTGSGRAGNFEIWTGDSTSSHNVFTATPDGKVGIGKTTVGTVHNATALEVAHGSIALDNGYGIFSTNSAGTGTGVGLHMSTRDELYLMAGGHVAMVIDPSYNVGISAPEPACKLDVGGVARVKGDAWPTDGAGMELAYNSTDHRGFIQVYNRQTNTWGDLFLGNGKVSIGRTSASYPLHIGTNSTNGNGAHLTVGGVWTNGSDRNSKRNVRPIDSRALLQKVVELPVTQWQYKGEPDDVKHIGPMAQDFHSAFDLGGSDKHIGTVDADGVALAAIQGLHALLKEKDQKIDEQQAQIDELRMRLDKIESMMRRQSDQ